MPRVVAFLLLTCCGSLPVLAVLQPAKIFSEHMVLQRDAAVLIWGKADAGSEVTVAFAGQSVETNADSKGRWKVKFQPMKPDADGRARARNAGVAISRTPPSSSRTISNAAQSCSRAVS